MWRWMYLAFAVKKSRKRLCEASIKWEADVAVPLSRGMRRRRRRRRRGVGIGCCA